MYLYRSKSGTWLYSGDSHELSFSCLSPDYYPNIKNDIDLRDLVAFHEFFESFLPSFVGVKYRADFIGTYYYIFNGALHNLNLLKKTLIQNDVIDLLQSYKSYNDGLTAEMRSMYINLFEKTAEKNTNLDDFRMITPQQLFEKQREIVETLEKECSVILRRLTFPQSVPEEKESGKAIYSYMLSAFNTILIDFKENVFPNEPLFEYIYDYFENSKPTQKAISKASKIWNDLPKFSFIKIMIMIMNDLSKIYEK